MGQSERRVEAKGREVRKRRGTYLGQLFLGEFSGEDAGLIGICILFRPPFCVQLVQMTFIISGSVSIVSSYPEKDKR